ncbi:DUF6479 family protein [Streptomyces zagrosensis]|uniref:Uncharacterized protein n=1 Tax=Streptomyces zagrosensis TaxID=1042984 RepID=A0A7W9V1D5_9ACTN|nr:DUF6479 family protein [Streptomyces zagrosensis]MBB5939168.1 hypothetical protein [Streptomyces zagrosensis]
MKIQSMAPTTGFPSSSAADTAVELAVKRDLLVGIGPFVAGIAVAAVLILAVAYGLRRRDREPPPPQEPQPRSGAWETADEHRTGRASADHGPGHQEGEAVGYITQNREPDEIPHEGRRMMPHEFKDHGNEGTRPATDEESSQHRRRRG